MPSKKISLGTHVVINFFIAAAILIVGAAMAPSATAAPTDDACSLLTPAQVSATMAVSVGAGTYITPTYKKSCTWWTTTASDTKSIQSLTLVLQSADAFESDKLWGGAKSVVITPISGVGDDAFYAALNDGVTLVVKKGSAVFKVTVYGSIAIEKRREMEKALAQLIVSKL